MLHPKCFTKFSNFLYFLLCVWPKFKKFEYYTLKYYKIYVQHNFILNSYMYGYKKNFFKFNSIDMLYFLGIYFECIVSTTKGICVCLLYYMLEFIIVCWFFSLFFIHKIWCKILRAPYLSINTYCIENTLLHKIIYICNISSLLNEYLNLFVYVLYTKLRILLKLFIFNHIKILQKK